MSERLGMGGAAAMAEIEGGVDQVAGYMRVTMITNQLS